MKNDTPIGGGPNRQTERFNKTLKRNAEAFIAAGCPGLGEPNCEPSEQMNFARDLGYGFDERGVPLRLMHIPLGNARQGIFYYPADIDADSFKFIITVMGLYSAAWFDSSDATPIGGIPVSEIRYPELFYMSGETNAHKLDEILELGMNENWRDDQKKFCILHIKALQTALDDANKDAERLAEALELHTQLTRPIEQTQAALQAHRAALAIIKGMLR